MWIWKRLGSKDKRKKRGKWIGRGLSGGGGGGRGCWFWILVRKQRDMIWRSRRFEWKKWKGIKRGNGDMHAWVGEGKHLQTKLSIKFNVDRNALFSHMLDLKPTFNFPNPL